MPSGSSAAADLPPVPGHGEVISLTRRLSAAGRAPVSPAQSAPSTAETALARTVQAMFLHRRRTLTDKDTAEAFDVTLSVVEMMLDGAASTRTVTSEQHGALRSLLEGIRATPGLL